MTSSNGNIFPRYWPFVWGIHRSPANSPHKGQWRGALMFSLIWAWINNCEAGDLSRHRAHYDVIAMARNFMCCSRNMVMRIAGCHILHSCFAHLGQNIEKNHWLFLIFRYMRLLIIVLLIFHHHLHLECQLCVFLVLGNLNSQSLSRSFVVTLSLSIIQQRKCFRV